MSTKLDLGGQLAYVTGGSRGIGLACVRAFAAAGADVAFCARSDAEQLQALAAEIGEEFGVQTLALRCDVADAEQVKASFKSLQKQFGRLDVFVNNAGFMDTNLLAFTKADSIQQTMDVNVTGALLNLQMAAKLMARKQRGNIVNISSIVGRYGAEGQIAYSASKAAIIGMTKAAAKEFASQGIRVNAVAPGFIETDLLSDFDEQKRQQVIDTIKLKRIGQVDEVAQAVLFLGSDRSAYITGELLGVDGGMLV